MSMMVAIVNAFLNVHICMTCYKVLLFNLFLHKEIEATFAKFSLIEQEIKKSSSHFHALYNQ